jgi:hypothetical protein
MANQKPAGRTPKRGVQALSADKNILFPASKASRNEAFRQTAGVSGLRGVRSREEALAAMDPNSRDIARGKTAVRRGRPVGERNKYIWDSTRAHGSVSKMKKLYVNPNNPY